MSSANPDHLDSPSHPASMQVVVDIGAASHAGRVRPNNEDSYLVLSANRSLETLRTNLPAGRIPMWSAERAYGFAVADGVGGQQAGEVASQLALKTVVEHILTTADWVLRDPAAHSERIEERMVERFAWANAAVQRQASLHPQLSGMGTTLTVAASLGSRLFVGHVGDSRAYLLRAGRLQVLTRDHSLVQLLRDTGVITPDEAASHHMRNVLLRCLGGSEAVADVQQLMLQTGDQLMLCTDGLYEMIPEPALGEILQSAPTSQAACDQLVASALDAGGTDNVTLTLARYGWKT